MTTNNKIILRPYQHEAVQAVYKHLRERDDNPCVVIPTAGGKTPVMATICRDAVGQWGGRVLILAHVKELLEQAVEKLHVMAPDMWMQIGIYSAGLKSRDTEHPIIVAGIQSVYERAAELDRFDLIMIDECFPAGTLIDGRPIEAIMPGEFVSSFNHRAQRIEKRRVSAVSRRSYQGPLTKVTLENGLCITCTPNHPFFTGEQYEMASRLVEGTAVYVSPLRPGNSHAYRKSIQGLVAFQPNVLHNPLCLRTSRRDLVKSYPSPESDERQCCSATHDDHPSPDRSSSATRRKRSRPHRAAGISSGATGSRMASRMENRNRFAEGRTTLVFRRPGHATSEPMCGSGRPFTFHDLPQAGRPATRRDPQPARVVRVEVIQQANLGRSGNGAGADRVYNLQVEGNGNYFANDVLVHNCHLIPSDGEGRYRTFLTDAKVVNPHVRLIGLTATPYRMSTGMICGPDNLLNHVCYEIGVRELIVQGYLCKLRSKAGSRKIDTSGLHIRAGEFVADEVQMLMNDDQLVQAACSEIVDYTKDRHSTLIFASGVEHAQHVQGVLRAIGHECGFVCGETLGFDRAETLRRFREGELKYLVNVNVLTTGFDAPNIDCVALLRPTNSPGLYYQMVGRGFRLHESKADCMVLDFGGNILRHGPVDALQLTAREEGEGGAPAKECPKCHALVHAAYAICPECGFEFPPPERKRHDPNATDAGVLSGEVTDTEYEVDDVWYQVHVKKTAGPSDRVTMRVDYFTGAQVKSEWVCFEHDGFAHARATEWWQTRSNDPMPGTCDEAVMLCQAGRVAGTTRITVRHVAGERWDRILKCELGPKPAVLEAVDGQESVDDGPLSGEVCVSCGGRLGATPGMRGGQFMCSRCLAKSREQEIMAATGVRVMMPAVMEGRARPREEEKDEPGWLKDDEIP